MWNVAIYNHNKSQTYAVSIANSLFVVNEKCAIQWAGERAEAAGLEGWGAGGWGGGGGDRTVNVFGPYLVEGDVNEPAGDKKKALELSQKGCLEKRVYCMNDWTSFVFF